MCLWYFLTKRRISRPPVERGMLIENVLAVVDFSTRGSVCTRVTNFNTRAPKPSSLFHTNQKVSLKHIQLTRRLTRPSPPSYFPSESPPASPPHITGACSSIGMNFARSITASDSPDLPLLTSTLGVLFAVATAGAEADLKGEKRGNATESGASAGKLNTAANGVQSAELAALAKGGAWGAVYDALKGPCMARAAELQSGAIPKKAEAAISADLATCLDNMACCAEVRMVRKERGKVKGVLAI